MPVALLPPLTRSGVWRPPGYPPDEPVLTAARYMRTREMSRWHRPRSGVTHGMFGHTSYRFWCGQSASVGVDRVGAREAIQADEIPEGDPVCGTCVGRAIGAGQDDQLADGPPLIFSPQRIRRPGLCPGGRRDGYYAALSGTAGRCLVCGSVEAVRGHGHRMFVTSHEPGPGLIPGCPFHAWRELTIYDGKVVCACRITEETP